jgi:hypothetical protein
VISGRLAPGCGLQAGDHFFGNLDPKDQESIKKEMDKLS